MNPLNVIVAGFPGENAARAFERALRAFPVRWCLAICKYREHLPDLQNAEVHWHHPGFLETVDWNTIMPLSADLVEAMCDCEVVFLEMMTRNERKGRRLSYFERKREFLRTLRYWNHILSERPIDLFLACDIPHVGPEYVLFSLCRHKKIPTMFFHPQPLQKTLFFETDCTPAEQIRRCYDESHSSVELTGQFSQYFKDQTTAKDNPAPWYMLSSPPGPLKRWWVMVTRIFLRSPYLFFRHTCAVMARIATGSFWKRTGTEWSAIFRVRRMFRFYDAHAPEPDLSKKYIYVPLHYQPECTTCPMGGVFVDQLLVVQLIAYCLPDDVLLYVKEHPRQQMPGRNITFYRDLLKMSCVRLIPKSHNTFRLIENSAAVATVTGKAGFEALFRNKPVLLFGHVFYEFSPGVFPIHTLDDCKKAMKAIFEQNAHPTLDEMKRFLKAMEKCAITGHLDPVDQVISDEENLVSVSEGLIKRITQRLGGSTPPRPQ